MKRNLPLLLIVFIIFQSYIYSQSPVVQQIINNVNQDSLVKYVKELSGVVPTIIGGTSQTIVSRHKLQTGNSLAETYIKQKLESYGLPTTIQSFSTTGKNVYAVKTGTEFPNKKYMICAHYDDMPSGTTAPGADDNASGTAAVIEAARILSQYSFPYTIVFALWDEEEQGLVGSAYYANQASVAGDSILGVINLDMIAYDGNNDGVCNIHNRAVGSSVQLYNKMVEINSQYGINLSIISYNPGSTYSDHASFWTKGYGAILLIEDDADFHPYYHTTSDLLQYFNQPYFLKNSKLAIATLSTFALNLNLDITHTPITSITTSQPINTTAFVSTSLQIGAGTLAPRLYYRTKTNGGTFGSFNVVTGTPLESGTYNFTIPALQLGTVCQYYIAAQDANSSIVKTLPSGGGGFNPPGSVPPSTFYQFFVAPLNVAMYDEANNISNWTASGSWNTTTSKYVSAPSSFTDSPSGNYLANTTSYLKYSNQINLTGILGAVLEFDTQWDIEIDYDYGQIQLSTNNGTTWISLAGQYTNAGTGTFQPTGEPLYDGTQSTWVHERIDISNYAGQQITIRFYFRSDGSVQQDGWYVDNIKISKYESVSTFQVSVPVNDGWNMVSVPGLHPADQNVTTWWSGKNPSAGVYSFQGGYQTVTTVTPGTGYWMNHLGTNTYNTGDEWPAGGIQFVAHNPLNANSGWNLIGGYEYNAATNGITTNPVGLFTGFVYGYSNGYQVADYIVPGYGYWINLSGAGQIILPEAGLKGNAKLIDYQKEDWGKIIVTDASGKSYTLYASKSGSNLDIFELPPAPPAGMFDVRYGSNRFVEELNSIQSVLLNGVEYPVRVRVENIDIRLQDESGSTVNTGLKSGEEVTISNSSVSKLMVSGTVIPDKYSLEQNYPNPFNPTTTIKFSMPVKTNLSLNVYNTLGEKVAEIFNGEIEEGYHELMFNASGLSSGVYFYKFESEKYNSIKKMILLK